MSSRLRKIYDEEINSHPKYPAIALKINVIADISEINATAGVAILFTW